MIGQRFFSAYDELEERQLIGDAGAGLIVGSVVCLALHYGGMSGSFYGLPYIIIYGGAIGIGVTLLSASFRVVPNKPNGPG